MSRLATIAEDSTLAQCGAVNDSGTLKLKGWEFSSHHDKILDTKAMMKLSRTLTHDKEMNKDHDDDHICVGNFKMHLPAMIFGNDTVKLQYHPAPESIPTCISLDSSNALKLWVERHTQDYLERYPWFAVQVPQAKTWKARKLSDEESNQEKISLHEISAWDWTFTSDYCGTIERGETRAPVAARTVGSTLEIIESSGLDMNLLRDTSQPILFYDEGDLYQDDLEDCGEVSMNFKIRVMPSCWLMLLRFFLRVDSSLILLREARYFHKFGTKEVFLDIIWQELKFSEVSSDPLIEALKVRISSDAKLQRDGNALSKLLPCVNDQQGIQKHLMLHL